MFQPNLWNADAAFRFHSVSVELEKRDRTIRVTAGLEIRKSVTMPWDAALPPQELASKFSSVVSAWGGGAKNEIGH